MTFAPRTFPNCSDAVPTPDETPLISSHSPGLSRPCNTSMSYATRNVSGMLAAASHDRAGGTAIASASSISAYSENDASASAHDAIARFEAGDLQRRRRRPRRRLPHRWPSSVPALPCRPWPSTNSPRLRDAACILHEQLARPGLGHRRLAHFEHGFRVGHLHPPGLHRRPFDVMESGAGRAQSPGPKNACSSA